MQKFYEGSDEMMVVNIIAVEWVKENAEFLRIKWTEYHVYDIPVIQQRLWNDEEN